MSEDKNLNEVLYTKKSLEIYRKLFSLIRLSGSEKEVVKIVIDSIYEQFPDSRVYFSHLYAGSKLRMVYSQQPIGWMNKTGKDFFVGDFYDQLPQLRQDSTLIVSDLREHSFLMKFFEEDLIGKKSLAVLSHSFELKKDLGAAITVLSPGPKIWSEESIAMIREVTDLMCLMIREIVARESLKDSETLFRQFGENIQSIFWMTDLPPKNKMIFISPAYENIWGRTCQSLYDNPHSFLEAIHAEDRERVKDSLQHQATGKYCEIYRVVKPSGQIRWVKDRAFPVKNEKDEVYRLVGIVEDITEMKELLTRLEATQSQALLNAKFAALGEMASGIAHEINNPLAVIHGLTAQLKEVCGKIEAFEPQAIESLNIIEKNTNRIASIIKGLRTFSRQIEFDKSVSVDLISIMQETLALFSSKFRNENIAVKIDIPVQRLFVRSHASEISQVFLHLLKNAHDAVLDQPQKWISAGIFAENGMARIYVEDSGEGIASEIKEKIYQPFFTTKDVGKGIGLGLSISKGIVEAHGGKLYQDSKAINTRFLVELPLEKSEK